MDANVYREIQKWAGELDGVFTLDDLRVMFRDRTDAALYKRLETLIEARVLIKVKPGFYATPDAELVAISQRIDPDAYLSTGTVLARAAVIGSIPAGRVQAVKCGRPRIYRCELGTIEHLSIAPHLFFGFELVDGVRSATAEKAFLDVCYYTYRGRRFSFDPATDMAVTELDRGRVEEYLSRYDKRFVGYFNRIWGDQW